MITKNYSLLKLNTFRMDARAKLFATFNSTEALKELLQLTEVRGFPLLVLGGGSNILFTRNFEGVVLKNNIRGIQKVGEDADHVYIKAGAGENWHDFVLYAIDNGFGGIENLSLIPGTVGASPIQNIGAYGVEIKDVVSEVEALEIGTMKTITFSREACHFGYRDSIFKKTLKDKYVITAVTYKLSRNPSVNVSYGAIKDTLAAKGIENPTIRSISEAVCEIRKSKLPDPAVIGNAGSFFKNPEIEKTHFEHLKNLFPELPSYPAPDGKVKIPAGWLIEKAGWKGKNIGNAGVHKNQALVLVNLGGATGEEIKFLSGEIRKSVDQLFKISLETEVNIF